MPKSNVKFPFEFKVLQNLSELANRLFDNPENISTFIIQTNERGEVVNTLNIRDNPEFNFWGDWSDEDSSQCYIFFDEIDEGEYIFIKWQNIVKQGMEQLLNIELSDDDFLDPAKNTHIPYPNSYNIMF